MEDNLALGLVAGGLFIAILMLYNRTQRHKKNLNQSGGTILGYGIIAGISAIIAKYLLSAKFTPSVTIFRQEPPF